MTALPQAGLPETPTADQDRLVRSSVLLLLATVVAAGIGMIFWVVVARMFPAHEVGIGSSMISATSMLAYLSLIGLNGTLVRFLGEGRRRDHQVGQSLLGVSVAGILVATGYCLLAPHIAPDLAVLGQNPWYAVTFVACTMLASVNLVTDSIFIGLRAPGWNLALDGVLLSLVKVVSPLFLVAPAALVVFGSAGLGYAVATAVSILVLMRRFGIRPRLGRRLAFSRPELHFSAANYVSSALNLVPVLALPMTVIARLGAAQAAYFFVAFQVAGILYAVSYAVGEAVFSEGSRQPELLRPLMHKAALVMVCTQVPAALVVAFGAPLVLRLFGASYASGGAATLVALAVAAPCVSLNAWTSFALKLTAQTTAMVLSNVVFVAVTVTLAWWLAPHGLAMVAWAWLAGNLAAGVVAGVSLLRHQRRVEALAGSQVRA